MSLLRWWTHNVEDRRGSRKRQNGARMRRQQLTLIFLSLLLMLFLIAGCDAQLFGGNGPQQRPRAGEGRGGILFGGGDRGGRDERVPMGGPVVGRLPPQNLLSRMRSSADDEEEAGGEVKDPRRPPKNAARMRLGPILLDPDHLVYDDNDDYTEEDEDVQPRPRFGLDIFSFLAPFSNFFAVLWKLFCTFVLKLEKHVNRMLGRDTTEGQPSILLVVSIAWFIFGSVAVVVNQIVNRLVRDPEDVNVDSNGTSTENKFLRIPSILPTVEMTPPTPTAASTNDVDGIEPPKRRRLESPRNFRRHPSTTSTPIRGPAPTSRFWSTTCHDSRILRRRENEKVKAKDKCDCSIIASFQRRIVDDNVSTELVEWTDETFHLICRDRFSRYTFQRVWIGAINQRISANLLKTFSQHFNDGGGIPLIEVSALKNLTFLNLKSVHLKTATEDSQNLNINFDVDISLSLVISMIPPFGGHRLVGSIDIDNLSTKLEVNVDTESTVAKTFHFRQSGFVDVRLHWTFPAGSDVVDDSLRDTAEEVVLEAVRNTEVKLPLEDLLYQEAQDVDAEPIRFDHLEVTLVRASNLRIFRNFNNNKTCSNLSDGGEVSLPSCPFITLEVDSPNRHFKTEVSDATFQPETSDVIWKGSQFNIPIVRDSTQELLVEVWHNEASRDEPTFLGLCIFPIRDLLLTTPTQTRTVTLQRRPFDEEPDEDPFNQSTITLMFRCALDPEVDEVNGCCAAGGGGSAIRSSNSLLRGVHKISDIRRSTGSSGQAVKTSTTTYVIGRNVQSPKRRKYKASELNAQIQQDDQLEHVHRVNAVALAALNDLERLRRAGKPGTAVERTTLFIRSVQKIEESQPEDSPTNGHVTSAAVTTTDDASQEKTCDAKDEDVAATKKTSTAAPSTTSASVDNPSPTGSSGTKPKKGILSTLKKKFYKSSNSSPKKQKKDSKGETKQSKPAVTILEGDNGSDSDSSCSDCSSERSFELGDWYGNLSLSWESLCPDGTRSSLLAPTSAAAMLLSGSAGNDDVSSLSDVSGISITSTSFKSGVFEEASSSNSDSAAATAVTAATADGPTLAAKGSHGSSPSALVLETVEFGIKRYYLIPNQLVKRGNKQLRKRGRKLHLCNDHVFVARHVKGSPSCSVCHRRIAARLGKQGYICRGCHLVCHKSCHQQVETICSQSAVSSMELFRGSTLVKI